MLPPTSSTPPASPACLPLQWCLYWDARRAASRELPPALAAPAGGAAAAGLASGAPTGSLQQPGTARAGRPAPAEDEADSAAVKRKRSAEEEAAAQHLKGISAESKKRLLEVAALPLAGTALEASAGQRKPASAGRPAGLGLAVAVALATGAPSGALLHAVWYG